MKINFETNTMKTLTFFLNFESNSRKNKDTLRKTFTNLSFTTFFCNLTPGYAWVFLLRSDGDEMDRKVNGSVTAHRK